MRCLSVENSHLFSRAFVSCVALCPQHYLSCRHTPLTLPVFNQRQVLHGTNSLRNVIFLTFNTTLCCLVNATDFVSGSVYIVGYRVDQISQSCARGFSIVQRCGGREYDLRWILGYSYTLQRFRIGPMGTMNEALFAVRGQLYRYTAACLLSSDCRISRLPRVGSLLFTVASCRLLCFASRQ